MDKLVASSLEHVRADNVRGYPSEIKLSHEGTTFVLTQNNDVEFVELSFGDDYAYAASLPTDNGVLQGFSTYLVDRRISGIPSDQYDAEHFEPVKQTAIDKARRLFEHVDTAPLAAVFRRMAPPDLTFQPPEFVPMILKNMVRMINDGKATISGSRRSNATLTLENGDKVMLSIIIPTFDEYATRKIPGFRITVTSPDDTPNATYTALVPTRGFAVALYRKLERINPIINGPMVMQLFGEEPDPNANMFTDEVIDDFINYTKHVGEKHFVQAMQDKYPTAFLELGGVADQFFFNKEQKRTAQLALGRQAGQKWPGVLQALDNWGRDRGRKVMTAGFTDMAAM